MHTPTLPGTENPELVNETFSLPSPKAILENSTFSTFATGSATGLNSEELNAEFDVNQPRLALEKLYENLQSEGTGKSRPNKAST